MARSHTAKEFPKMETMIHATAEAVLRFFGIALDDDVPQVLHALLHIVLIVGPALLSALAVYYLARLTKKFRSNSARRAEPFIEVEGVERSLLAHVFARTQPRQIYLVILSLAVMPVFYLTLELPKQIVNNVLGTSHQQDVSWLYWSFSQSELLSVLSLLFLAAISLNGLIKYQLNTAKGRVAERFLRHLRLRIYREWRLRKTSARKPEVHQVMGPEIEPLGGFASDFLTLPITQGGTFVTILVFMFAQDPILGAAAIAILPVQLTILPKLQKLINRLSRLRIMHMRRLSHKLTSQMEPKGDLPDDLSEIIATLRKLEETRLRIHRAKFLAKALTNFLTSLTPFFFYLLGGFLVLQDRITLGALIAVLAAHKDFSAPLKELFRFYQQLQDTKVRYREVLRFLHSACHE